MTVTKKIQSSFGVIRALQHGSNINHVEFRLLVRLSDLDDGTKFGGYVSSLSEYGRMTKNDIYDAIVRLSSPPFSEPIRLEGDTITWGPFNA